MAPSIGAVARTPTRLIAGSAENAKKATPRRFCPDRGPLGTLACEIACLTSPGTAHSGSLATLGLAERLVTPCFGEIRKWELRSPQPYQPTTDMQRLPL